MTRDPWRKNKPTSARFIRLALACGAVVALCLAHAATASAQREFGPAAPLLETVYLDTDTAAAKKLAAARDFIAARQWRDAVELIRQVADQHADRLVGIEPGRYVNVQNYCDILLSSLPAEGLQFHRTRIDPQARRWLETAQATLDEETLLRIVNRAFLSSSGEAALLLLGELAFERGDLRRARAWWEKLLPTSDPAESDSLPTVLKYPSPAIDPALVRARLVLCSLFQADLPRGRRELAAFKHMHPQAEGRLAGRTGNLAATLAALAEGSAATQLAGADSVAISTYAGNAERNHVTAKAVDVGSVQWSAPLIEVRSERRPQMPVFDWAERQFLDRLERGLPAQSQEVLSYYPVIWNDLVFVCDDWAVYAYELESDQPGRPAWTRDAAKPSTAEALAAGRNDRKAAIEATAIFRFDGGIQRSTVPARQRVGLPRFTMTIDHGRLYARMGNSTAQGRNPQAPRKTNALVCLDLVREGDLLWTTNADELDAKDGGGGGAWMFDGAPVVAEGRVFVALRRSDPQVQLNVACFDGASGRLLWNRKVATGVETFGPEVEEIHHQLLTFADDRIFYCTNVGAVASLAARDGTLQWVATYRRLEPETLAAFNRRQQTGPNPCVAHDGTIYAAPTDAELIVAYDSETGIVNWQRELKGNVRQLLGVVDGRLIAAGDMLWGLDAETGATTWFRGQGEPAAATAGRGVLAEGLVYWPRREEIMLIDAATGRVLREIPLLQQYGLKSGNLAIADGHLLMAQSNRLVVFSEFGSVKQRPAEVPLAAR